MANRFWVGNDGSLADTNHWSATSGGSGGASVPTSSDDVFFDANSLTANSTIGDSASLTCRNVDCTGLAYNLNVRSYQLFSPNDSWNIYGNATFNSKVSFDAVFSRSINIVFKATSGTFNIDLGGIDSNPSIVSNGVYIDGGASYNLINSTVYSTIILSKGILNVNTTISPSAWIYFSSSNAKTLNLGSSTVGNISTFGANNLTINAGTSNIILDTTGSISFGYGYTWYNVECTGTGTVTFTGNSTYHDIKLKSATTTKFTAGTTTTLTGRLTANGTSGNLITLESTSAGTSFELSKSSGLISVDYYSIKDCDAVGGASWYAGTHSTDVSGNSGWMFEEPSFNLFLGTTLIEKIYLGETEITELYLGENFI